MHPESIMYKKESYSLAHLSQSFGAFDWIPKGGEKIRFSVRVRYSNHCYSRSLKDGEVQEDHDVVIEQEPLRLFCLERHQCTKDLVKMVDGLFVKPTTGVQLTYESNWHIYQLYAKPKDGTQRRYCVFFRVKKTDVEGLVDGAHALDMVVESAYVRENMVATRRRVPFGTVASLTLAGERYF